MKTGGVDLKDAAALPLAGLTAYQALFTGAGRSFAGADLFKLQSGNKILIIGGTTLVVRRRRCKLNTSAWTPRVCWKHA